MSEKNNSLYVLSHNSKEECIKYLAQFDMNIGKANVAD